MKSGSKIPLGLGRQEGVKRQHGVKRARSVEETLDKHPVTRQRAQDSGSPEGSSQCELAVEC